MADHFALQRSLSILRCLQRGPADRYAVADFVAIDLGTDAYPPLDQSVGRKQVENDIKRLRDFGIDIQYRAGEYHLISYGDFSPVSLTESELETLAFLVETFAPGAPHSAGVQALLRHLADWLPSPQRDSIATRRQRLRLDLRRRDDDQIEPHVQTAIDRAISQHRLLRFHYRSPSQADGVPRVHTVQPWQLYYDSIRHHLYLEAYRLEVTGPFGPWTTSMWTRYRVGRILATELSVLPDKFAPIPPKRPRIQLEYWLAPEIARLGEITRHFEGMVIGGTNAEGWVQVTATTDDLFRAVRLLLGYGPNCKVTGGSEAKQEMVALVQAMGQVYEEG